MIWGSRKSTVFGKEQKKASSCSVAFATVVVCYGFWGSPFLDILVLVTSNGRVGYHKYMFGCIPSINRASLVLSKPDSLAISKLFCSELHTSC